MLEILTSRCTISLACRYSKPRQSCLKYSLVRSRSKGGWAFESSSPALTFMRVPPGMYSNTRNRASAVETDMASYRCTSCMSARGKGGTTYVGMTGRESIQSFICSLLRELTRAFSSRQSPFGSAPVGLPSSRLQIVCCPKCRRSPFH